MIFYALHGCGFHVLWVMVLRVMHGIACRNTVSILWSVDQLPLVIKL